MTNTNGDLLSIKSAIFQWEQQVQRGTNLINRFSDATLSEQLLPGKNTGNYIIGHLIAMHDGIPEFLGVGKRMYPELIAAYLLQPEGPSPFRSMEELRSLWTEVHERVALLILTLPEDEWLKRHEMMSDADFQENPLRNKLSVLLNRTNHFAYHLGQLRLFA